MNRSAPAGEKVLLARIHRRLIFWLLLAFLLLEAIVIGSAYVVLQDHLLVSARQSIVDEWSHKASDALSSLRDEEKSLQTDLTSEVVATWVVAPSGRVVKADQILSGVPSRLGRIFPDQSAIEQARLQGHVVWRERDLGGIPVLTGTRILYAGGRYQGVMQSAYSLRGVRRTMRALLFTDASIGLWSLLLVLPLAYLLSQRSLIPIRSALQRQRDFVQDASHELRTPLTILRATLELAGQESDPREFRSAAIDALTEVDYLSRMVGDLSTLARMESGTTPVDLQVVDLARITREALDAMKPVADGRRVSLTANGCDTPLVVTGDPVRLRQILLILLENGIKYNREGGRVVVALRREAHSVRMAVSDTGIGIVPEELPKIFHRFYRSRRGSQYASGSGLGLAIAAWIVEAHRGSIDVSSKVGEGTTFRISLPLPRRTAGQNEKDAAARRPGSDESGRQGSQQQEEAGDPAHRRPK